MPPALQKQLFHLLMHTGKLLEDRVRKELQAAGIHHGQGRVLGALARNGELSQIQIAEGLHIERATVTDMIQRMEKRGLVTRAKDTRDPRVKRVSLTPAGRRAEARVRKVWDKLEADIRRAIPADRVELARDLLTSIRNGLGGADPDV